MRMACSKGIFPTFVEGHFINHKHCWIEHYGMIIDITATQFGSYKPIHIVKKQIVITNHCIKQEVLTKH